MASWRETQAVMDGSTIATFGESVTINGFCVIGNVLESDFQSNGLDLAVEGEQAQIYISSQDKERIRLAKGQVVEYRDKTATVVEINITNTTLCRIVLG